MAREQNLDPTRCSNDIGSLMLRLSASFKGRFVALFLSEEGDPREIYREGCASSCKGPWDILRVLGASPEVQRDIVARAVGTHGCSSCRGLFLVRLGRRLRAPPVLTLDEMVPIVVELCAKLAEDPYALSMHGCELLHADTRQATQGCLTRRKLLPLSVFSKQVLGRFATLHRVKLGSRRVLPKSVKKKVAVKRTVKPLGSQRKYTGHQLYLRDSNAARRAQPKANQVPYSQHLSSCHRNWREVMTEDEKAVYEARAENENQVRPALFYARIKNKQSKQTNKHTHLKGHHSFTMKSGPRGSGTRPHRGGWVLSSIRVRLVQSRNLWPIFFQTRRHGYVRCVWHLGPSRTRGG